MKSLSLSDLRRQAWAAAIVGGVASAVSALRHADAFCQSYLYAYVCIAGIAIGCLGILLLHLLVGGRWGRVSRRVLSAATRTLPWLGLLFLPVLLGLKH